MSKFLNPVCGGYKNNFFKDETCESCRQFKARVRRFDSRFAIIFKSLNLISKLKSKNTFIKAHLHAAINAHMASRAFMLFGYSYYSQCTCPTNVKAARKRKARLKRFMNPSLGEPFLDPARDVTRKQADIVTAFEKQKAEVIIKVKPLTDKGFASFSEDLIKNIKESIDA